MNSLISFSVELGYCILLSKVEIVFVLEGRILWYEYVDFDLHRLDFEFCKVLFEFKELETKL